MSVTSSSLVKTLIPSGGSLDKLVSSFTTCLIIWGWRFSTFELVWNWRERSKGQWLPITIGEKLIHSYLPMPFVWIFLKPEKKKGAEKLPFERLQQTKSVFREANAQRSLRFWFVILLTNQIADWSTARSQFLRRRGGKYPPPDNTGHNSDKNGRGIGLEREKTFRIRCF